MGSDAATWLKNYVLTAPITKGDKEESHKMPCCKCNMLKVREKLQGPDENGIMVYRVTDGDTYIMGIFTRDAIVKHQIQERKEASMNQQSLGRNESQDSSDIENSIIALKHYSLEFLPGETYHKSIFQMVIFKFRLFCRQDVLYSKQKTLNCMNDPDVQNRAAELWQQWRDEKDTSNQASWCSTTLNLSELLINMFSQSSQASQPVQDDPLEVSATTSHQDAMSEDQVAEAASKVIMGAFAGQPKPKLTPFTSEEIMEIPSHTSVCTTTTVLPTKTVMGAFAGQKYPKLDPVFSAAELIIPTQQMEALKSDKVWYGHVREHRMSDGESTDPSLSAGPSAPSVPIIASLNAASLSSATRHKPAESSESVPFVGLTPVKFPVSNESQKDFPSEKDRSELNGCSDRDKAKAVRNLSDVCASLLEKSGSDRVIETVNCSRPGQTEQAVVSEEGPSDKAVIVLSSESNQTTTDEESDISKPNKMPNVEPVIVVSMQLSSNTTITTDPQCMTKNTADNRRKLSLQNRAPKALQTVAKTAVIGSIITSAQKLNPVVAISSEERALADSYLQPQKDVSALPGTPNKAVDRLKDPIEPSYGILRSKSPARLCISQVSKSPRISIVDTPLAVNTSARGLVPAKDNAGNVTGAPANVTDVGTVMSQHEEDHACQVGGSLEGRQLADISVQVGASLEQCTSDTAAQVGQSLMLMSPIHQSMPRQHDMAVQIYEAGSDKETVADSCPVRDNETVASDRADVDITAQDGHTEAVCASSAKHSQKNSEQNDTVSPHDSQIDIGSSTRELMEACVNTTSFSSGQGQAGASQPFKPLSSGPAIATAQTQTMNESDKSSDTRSSSSGFQNAQSVDSSQELSSALQRELEKYDADTECSGQNNPSGHAADGQEKLVITFSDFSSCDDSKIVPPSQGLSQGFIPHDPACSQVLAGSVTLHVCEPARIDPGLQPHNKISNDKDEPALSTPNTVSQDKPADNKEAGTSHLSSDRSSERPMNSSEELISSGTSTHTPQERSDESASAFVPEVSQDVPDRPASRNADEAASSELISSGKVDSPASENIPATPRPESSNSGSNAPEKTTPTMVTEVPQHTVLTPPESTRPQGFKTPSKNNLDPLCSSTPGPQVRTDGEGAGEPLAASTQMLKSPTQGSTPGQTTLGQQHEATTPKFIKKFYVDMMRKNAVTPNSKTASQPIRALLKKKRLRARDTKNVTSLINHEIYGAEGTPDVNALFKIDRPIVRVSAKNKTKSPKKKGSKKSKKEAKKVPEVNDAEVSKVMRPKKRLLQEELMVLLPQSIDEGNDAEQYSQETQMETQSRPFTPSVTISKSRPSAYGNTTEDDDDFADSDVPYRPSGVAARKRRKSRDSKPKPVTPRVSRRSLSESQNTTSTSPTESSEGTQVTQSAEPASTPKDETSVYAAEASFFQEILATHKEKCGKAEFNLNISPDLVEEIMDYLKL